MTTPALASRLGHALVGASVNALSLGSLLCLAGPVVAAWFPVLAESRGLQAAALVLSSLPGGAWCLRRHAQEWRVPLAVAAGWLHVPYLALVAASALGWGTGLALGGSPGAVLAGITLGLGAGALGPLLTAATAVLVRDDGRG